jgi:hypothetical protein
MIDYERLSALGWGADPHGAPLIVSAENNPHELLSTYVVKMVIIYPIVRSSGICHK